MIRASIDLRNKFFRREMDHRVKPGDDEKAELLSWLFEK